jgi:hypothetical protein
MIACKPVTVQRHAFEFCKTSLAVALWTALIFRLPWLVLACSAVLAASAVLTVTRAPLVVLYRETLGRAWPGGPEVLDERAMRFAHTLGATLCAVCAALIYAAPRVGYSFLVFVAVAKTSGALGFCSALKLYGCLNSDTCCRWVGRRV